VSGLAMSDLRRVHKHVHGSMPVLFGGVYGMDAGRRSGMEWKHGRKWSKSAYLPVSISLHIMKLISND
jgi:hypothetical protein